ncbi:stress response translation initiation inhibitor YciH [Halomicroarcula sp. GCM10025817]|uniref:stress response translation initiation inhibitor YciH n=1 Tax=Haloarcula TaxID=2237 RepID=UPI0023E75DC2|nr:stress response translation initiation inhibitor YciH [Halomicroarcula sp. SYNS111]
MSKDTLDIAGLPDDLGLMADLDRAQQRVRMTVNTRRYGKAVTVVDGLDPKTVDLDELASTLKRTLAVGGTVTDDRIELQGRHGDRLREALAAEGFDVEA